MIMRTWHGTTQAADGNSYLEYLKQTGFAGFRSTPGNMGAFCLRRIIDGRAEFVVVSMWDSAESIRAFAGDDIEVAVFYPEDARFLIERDMHVNHYEVVHRAEP